MALLYSIDKYGIKNYKTMPILLVASVAFMCIVAVAAHLVLGFEAASNGANVKTYANSFWLCFMAASTIGFGDFYPTTTGGRVIIGNMFILGGVMLGIIIGLVSNAMMSFTDTSVKNKELKKQSQDLLNHNIKLERLMTKMLAHNKDVLNHNIQLEGSLRELRAHNETILIHNKLVESKLDVLMEHMDEVTDLEMDIDKKLDLFNREHIRK